MRKDDLSRRRFLALGLLAPVLAACGGSPAATPVPAATAASSSAVAPAPTAAPPTAAPPTSAAAAPTAAPTATSASAVAPTPTAATTPAAQGAATGGAALNLAWRSTAPVSFNPLFSTSGSEQQVERLIFGALLKMSDQLIPTPDLAKGWDISTDATTYTFHLNAGITWSDGQPLTSDDVVFTFERAIDKRTGSIWAGRLSGIAGAADYASAKADTVSGLSAPDATTFQVKLAQPNAAFLTTLGNFSGLGILPKHVLGSVPPDQLKAHPFSTQAPTIGAGAYSFVQYASGQYVQLKRNDTYFRGKVALNQIYLKILDPATALAQLQTGEVDFMSGVPISEISRLKQDANLTVFSVVSPSISQIAIFNDRPYFKDKRVRQAMMYAIDRQGIIDSIMGGQATLVNSPILGPSWMGQPEFTPYSFDAAKAKSLLKDAGWDPSQKIQIMEPTGPSKEQQAYSAVIQQQLHDAGFDVSVFQADGAQVSDKYIAKPDFDLFDFGGGVYRAEPSIAELYYGSKEATPAGGNGTHYKNPQLDKLFDQGVATADQAQRKQIYTQIAQIVNDDVPTVFLWSPNSISATRKRFQGYKPPSYIDNFLWNAEDWSVSS
jgi:ABC-type transport system substrate-binding protein